VNKYRAIKTELEFTVPGEPVPWQRPDNRKGGGRMDTPRNKAVKQHIALEATKAMRGKNELLDGPLKLSVAFFYSWPKSYSHKRRMQPCAFAKDTKPDLSNLVKLVEDALNGIVWIDDGQVCEYGLVSKRFINGEPYTQVKIEVIK